MTYLMRFIIPDGEPPTLAEIGEVLHRLDEHFVIFPDAADKASGDLMYAEDVYGEIEINSSNDVVFTEDIQELLDAIAETDEINVGQIREFLDKCSGMVALRVSELGHFNTDRLDMLWDWLFETRGGLLQVDGEGYYDRDRLVLPVAGDDDDF